MNQEDDLIQRIYHAFESKDVDYKGPIKWDEGDKALCCGIVKDILAMANTLGGNLIIGVAESPTGYIPEGLTEEQAGTFETSRINRFVNRYADPPINVTLRKILIDDKVFVVIQIPRFTTVPHICVKDYPCVLSAPTLYVRTNNNESAPLRSSDDFQQLIEQAVRNRADLILSSVQAILSGTVTRPTPSTEKQYQKQFDSAVEQIRESNPFKQKGYVQFREASFSLATFDQTRFTLNQLRPAIRASEISFRGWPFVYVGSGDEIVSIQDGIESLIIIPSRDACDFWRLQTSGFFYQRALREKESIQRCETSQPVVGVLSTLYYIAEALDCMVRLYENLGVDGDETIVATIRLLGTKGTQLVVDTPSRRLPFAPFERYICQIDEVKEQAALSLATWKASLVDKSVQIFQSICLKFNWEANNATLSQFRKDVQDLYKRKL